MTATAPSAAQHRFTKSMADYAPGVLWLAQQRIAEHREKFGGRLPRQLLMHGPAFRRLIEEHAQLDGMDLNLLPPTEIMAGAELMALDRVPVFQCHCGRPMAQDQLIACDGTVEEL